MPPTRLPRKKDVVLALLEKSSVFVHLDPRGERVRVPTWFRKQPQLVLQIGLNMTIPIPDLHVDDEGLSCTLSFNRSPHLCVVPWSSVYALVGEDGRGMVWPDDVPPEVAAQMQQKPSPKPKLAAVGQAPGPEAEAKPAAAAPETKPERDIEPAPLRPAARRGKAKQADAASKEKKEAKPAAAKKKRAPRRKAEQRDQPDLRPVADPVAEKPAAGAAAGGKGKRELPPYLRVIK